MSYGDLLKKLPEDLKKDIRKYEALRKKIIDAIWSLVFNRTCINEGLLPNYTRFIYTVYIYIYICIRTHT